MAALKTLRITILSPEKTLFEGEGAAAVYLPGTVSPFEVLPGHAPIISTLTEGQITIKKADGSNINFAVEGGIAKIKDNIITVCVS